MGELPEARARDDDECGGAHVRNQIQRKEDDELRDLDDAPGRVDRGAGRSPEALDGGRGVREDDAVGGDELLVGELDQDGLEVLAMRSAIL